MPIVLFSLQSFLPREQLCYATLGSYDILAYVFEVAILSVCLSILSVRLSVVCLSVTRVLCDRTKQCTADILIPHERAITVVFWHQPSVWNLRSKWLTSFGKRRLQQISAYDVSTVRDNEKSSIMTNRKSTTGFPTSYCGVRTLSQVPKGWLKNDF